MTALRRALPTPSGRLMNINPHHIMAYTSKRHIPKRRVLAPAAAVTIQPRPCDVFLNHRGADTKQTVAGLLYDRLVQLGLRPFLDSRSMEPGDKLYESINAGILGCKVGVAIFSPRYCESFFCLHELALMVETGKKLIPIFCDIKPSELRVVDDHNHPPVKLDRFRRALQEAKYTVGLTFDSHTGNWSDLVSRAADIILKNITEHREF